MRAILAVALFAGPAFASSEAAWEAFRADVLAKCQALVPQADQATIEVNPFGSDHYGAAIVTTRSRDGAERAICIYDKRSKTAELTAPVAQPSASPQDP